MRHPHTQTLMSNLRGTLRITRHHWGWGVRILLIWLALIRINPTEPRAILGEPQQVITQKPKVCVHTRLIDEVEGWKIQRSLQLVREMGADHIVEFFPWAYVEHQRGHYDWGSVDRIMHHAQNQGIKVIVRTGYVPDWAREWNPQTTLNTLPEKAYPDFARFVSAFAERYAGTAEQIIIWNEPNLSFEWGFEAVDPVAYVRLLQTVYPVAHAANPNIEILMAGLAPTLENTPNALDDVRYLEAIYNAGGGDYFDGVAIHTYGFTRPANDPPAPDVLNFRRAELLYDVMVRNGDSTKPVYITETGWNDDPQWALAVRPSQRAIHTIDGLQLAESWEWLDQICIWMLRTSTPTNSHQDGFTMITSDFRLKAIYYAVQAYARGDERNQTLWLPPPNGN